MRTLLLVPALAGGLLYTTTAIADGTGKAFTMAVYGDSPYGTSPSDTAQLEETPTFIDAINADKQLDLIMQVGDIHSGKQFCTEAYDRSIYQLWTAFKKPLVYTPGDNEWADCHKAAEGGGAYNKLTGKIDYQVDASGNPIDYAKGDPVANLALIRSIFFSRPGRTLGGESRNVLTQAEVRDPAHPSDASYVENVIFTADKTLFVAINVPGGSNNDKDVWYGAPTATAAQTQEASERTGADLRWLDRAFAMAKEQGVNAVVIQTQADMWDAEKGAAHQAGYEPFVKSIADHTVAFGKPVLMFNGDSHVFLSDNPFDLANPIYSMHPGYTVPNFHRIVVHGSTFPMEYLKVTINHKSPAPAGPDTFGPFSWERVTP
jgi:hypothetical protein